MTSQDHTSDTADVREAFRPLWARRWLILLIVVLTTVTTYVWRDNQDPTFESGTSIYLQRADSPDPLAQSEGPLPIDDRSTATQAALLRSSEIGERVKREIDFEGSTENLLESLEVTPVEGSDFLNIVASRPDAREAADIANAFAKVFIEFRTEQYKGQIDRAIATARFQLGQARGSSVEERQSLRDQLRRLEFLSRQPAAGARQVDEAAAPSQAVSPRPKRDALFAAVMALFIAIGLAFLLERMDRRLKTVEEVDGEFAAPVLAVLPHSGNTHPMEDGAAVIAPELKEAFRMLRTNLSLAAIDRPVRKILVTSALPGEGKSTTTRNLAVLYREWGLRVAIVDADLRRPRMHALLGVQPERGLLQVLTGETTLHEALEPVSVQVEGLETLARIRDRGGVALATAPVPRAGAQNGHGEVMGSLDLLAGGGTPANPAAVLAADQAHTVLEELASQHDVVLVDSAPLLAVADSVPLLSEVDGVVLVVRMGETTRDSVRRTMDLLSRVPESRLLGVVVNDVETDGPQYAYSYSAR